MFNLRRVKKVEFSNTALLKRVKEESSSKRKPVELLILISRILGIILLVLAFARPIYKDRDNDLTLQNEVLIYLDNSQSLSVKSEGGQTGFDDAYSLSQGIVNSYPEGTVFRFIENGYSNSVATEFTRASLTDNLTELEQVNVGRSFGEIVQRKNGQNIKGDVYLVSDFQETDGLDELSKDTTSQYFLVPVTGSDYSNVSVDTAFLQNTFLSGDVTNLLKVRFKRTGKDINQINVKLYFENQLSGTAQLDFGDQVFLDHEFEIPASQLGVDKIRIAIDDSGLTFDNDYYVSINQLDRVRVLEIYGDNTPRYVSSLFEENELFQFSRSGVNSLDNQSIESADFILINQLDFLSNQLKNSIMNFLGSGKTVVFIPSKNMKPSDASGLGLTLLKDTGERIVLDVPDYENPFFQGIFEETSESLEMPAANVSLRLINEELAHLSFKNGRSFLSKVSIKGNLFFFSSSFDTDQTSFTNHALFVPVMYKLALGSKINLSNIFYYTDSETIFYPIDKQNNNNVYELRNGEQRLIPDQRQEESRLIMEIPKDQISAGHYELYLNEAPVGVVAFNLPRSESEVHPVDFTYLEELGSADNVTQLISSNSLNVEQEILSGINGIALWKYALLAALLFLFVEIILIRYL